MLKRKREPAEEPPPPQPASSIADLLEQIDFAIDNVVGAAATNPGLFVKAIDFRFSCMRKRSAAKMAWEKGQAEADLAIRRDARASGEKVTERFIEEQVLLDPNVTALAEAYATADELEEYSKLIVEAFRMRRDCLRIVGDLTRDEMALQRAVDVGRESLDKTRRRLRERFPGGA